MFRRVMNKSFNKIGYGGAVFFDAKRRYGGAAEGTFGAYIYHSCCVFWNEVAY